MGVKEEVEGGEPGADGGQSYRTSGCILVWV